MFAALGLLAVGLALQLAVFAHGGHTALSDLPRVFLHRGVGPDAFPYVDRATEYPVGSGLLLYVAALISPGALGVLLVTALASAALCLVIAVALERRVGDRAWRWALAVPVLLYAFQNWDVFAIAALVAGLLAFERRRDWTAGAALGLGAAVKLFPAIVLPPLIAVRLARGDRRGAVRLAASSAIAFVAINLPVLLANPSGWWWPTAFQSRRNATWGSAWFYLFRLGGLPVHGATGARLANVVSLVALVAAVSWLTIVTMRRRLPPLAAAGAAVAIFILCNKVYSPTYDLWLVVFFVLLPLSSRLWAIFCGIDLAVFITVYGHFHGLDSTQFVRVVLPVLVAVRTVVLIVLVFSSTRPLPTAWRISRPARGGSRPPLGRACRPGNRQAARSRAWPSVFLVPLLMCSLVGMTGADAAGAASTTTTIGASGQVTAATLPTPRPSSVDASGTVSAFPAPGTLTASPTTTITLRGVDAATLSSIDVSGAKSGSHAGHFQPHADGLGTTFVPDAAFTAGERVTVTTGLSVRAGTNGRYMFTVARPAAYPGPVPATTATGDLQHFVSRPDLTPPVLTLTTPPKNTAPGDIFLTPRGGGAQNGPLVVDDEGQLVWSAPVPDAPVYNLQLQQYRGQPVLTWYQGPTVNPGIGQGMGVIADASYRTIAQVHAVNGYAADLHDMTITPQGTALLVIYNPVIVDASSVGGSKNQHVFEPVIQEIDIATGALLFEWHGIGSIALNETHAPMPTAASTMFDYVHPNSVALDDDGNVLLSGRHTWTVYKIDRVSATLDWRLGGKVGNFTMPKNAMPAWQHDARRNSDGTLSVFDDGAGLTTTHKSRGLVLGIDEHTMTATLDHQYFPPKPIQSTAEGSMQLLANGDWLVGWGSQPEYTEYAPDGTVVYDVHFRSSSGGPVTSYRALRYEWSGRPTDVPAVAAARTSGDATKVDVSWNGATEVSTWAVLAGPDAEHLTRVASAPKKGFETSIPVVSNQPYFAVQALDAAGAVLATSAPTTPRA